MYINFKFLTKSNIIKSKNYQKPIAFDNGLINYPDLLICKPIMRDNQHVAHFPL